MAAHPKTREVYDVCSQNHGEGFIIVFCGPRGGGKTQTATSLACDALEDIIPQWKTHPESHWPMYRTFQALYREIRTAFGPLATQTETALMQKFSEPRLLVLDESQECVGTAFEIRVLNDLIDHRYGMQRDTLLISNLSREKLPAHLGPSIISRIHEVGEVFEFNWESFREGKAQP